MVQLEPFNLMPPDAPRHSAEPSFLQMFQAALHAAAQDVIKLRLPAWTGHLSLILPWQEPTPAKTSETQKPARR